VVPPPDPPRAQGRIRSVVKNKWHIDARLGAGGMAVVYAATHRNGNRVALKVLNYEWSRDPTVRARFLREGYLANSVGHPGAVKVLDDDVAEDGCVFLVMELLEGESLETRRERLGGRLPVDEVFTVGDQLLDLLDVAHHKGIVHRDIKPQNVFVTKEGVVKVLDFGIARMRLSAGESTSTGLMLGTPDFMSPEQAAGNPEQVDARSDLWSVGATLFTLLSGQSVHSAQTLREYLLATATSPARSLAAAVPGAPPPLVLVVDRALALHKELRWQDARAMQDALRWAYKTLAEARQAEGLVTITDPPPPPSDPFGEATQYEPVPAGLFEALEAGARDAGVDAFDRTVRQTPDPMPEDDARASEPPTVLSAPRTPRIARPATRPLYPMPIPGEQPASPAGVRAITGSGPIAVMTPPPQGAWPAASASEPATLGAQTADPRKQTGATRKPAPLGAIALLVLVVAVAGIAIYAVSVGLRSPPPNGHDRVEPAKLPASAIPLPSSTRSLLDASGVARGSASSER
jgi:eukaryotic-like serine/threonine-protein kinase